VSVHKSRSSGLYGDVVFYHCDCGEVSISVRSVWVHRYGMLVLKTIADFDVQQSDDPYVRAVSHACVFAVEMLRQIESELRVRYGRRAALSVLIPLVTRLEAGGVATFGTTATGKAKWRHDHPRARAPPVCV
jgi:hypothetical protein